MKICTFNVNSIRARKDLIIKWLNHRENDLDVLLIQELKAIPDQFPYTDFQALGFSCAVFGQKAYNGVCICTKLPMESVVMGFQAEQWDDQKRMISARIQGITIVNVYAPHGGFPGSEKHDYKQAWYKRFLYHLDTHWTPQIPLIAAGDFNVALQNLDLYSPEELLGTIGTLKEERNAFQKILDWGVIDVFRHLHPNQKQFTWWDYQTAGIWRDEGMRIDYFLCSEPLIPRIKGIEVDLWPRRRRTPTPSDHAPVILTLY